MDDSNFEFSARSVAGQPEQFAGQTIFAQGETGTHMYIVRTGSVDILIGERAIETIGLNGIFGEMALVDGGARSATARAKYACELAPIDQRTFVLMVDEAPYFALSLMRVVASRLWKHLSAAMGVRPPGASLCFGADQPAMKFATRLSAWH